MPGYPLRAVLSLLLWAVHGPSSIGAETPQSPIEITQVDLFSLRGWDSSQVTFLGFRLGMERNEAFRNAQNRGLTIDDDSGQGCLRAATCNLLKSGRYIGLSLSFGVRDSIRRIRVETPPTNASKEEKESWLITNMPGQTRELFEDYSDVLRARLLGVANANWFDAPRGITLPGDEHANQEFQYYSKGLILQVRSKETKPSEMPQKTQVSADFLFPK
jgi:hypothetical protein